MRRSNYLCGALMATAAFATSASSAPFNSNIGVTATVTYDSNVARSDEALAEARDLKESDVIGTILATVDVVRPIGRQTVSIQGSAGYRTYRSNSALDSETINLSAAVSRDIGPCATTADTSYARGQSDLQDVTIEPVHNIAETTSVGLAVSCGGVIGITPNLAVSQRWSENSAALRSTSNYDSLSVTAGLGYRRPTLGTISLFGSYVTTDYPNRLVLIGPDLVQDGYEAYSAGVKYSRAIGARLQGTLSFGYTKANPKLSQEDNFGGVTYGASLSYRPSSRVGTSLSLNRSVSPSNRLNTTYGVDDSVSANVSYKVSSRMNLNFGGAYSESSYQGGVLINGLQLSEEQSTSVFGAVSYNLRDRISLNLDVSQVKRDANLSPLSYESQRVGLTAKAGF